MEDMNKVVEEAKEVIKETPVVNEGTGAKTLVKTLITIGGAVALSMLAMILKKKYVGVPAEVDEDEENVIIDADEVTDVEESVEEE